MVDKRTERIIGIYTLVIALCGCFLVGFLLYDSHIKGIRGEAYDVRIQDDYLMFIADMSSSIKLDEIESVQFYNESVPEQDGIKIGTGTSEFLTGKTSLNGIGNCYVYVYKNKDYYVYSNPFYVFNYHSVLLVSVSSFLSDSSVSSNISSPTTL